jgi:hypothetical protein
LLVWGYFNGYYGDNGHLTGQLPSSKMPWLSQPYSYNLLMDHVMFVCLRVSDVRFHVCRWEPVRLTGCVDWIITSDTHPTPYQVVHFRGGCLPQTAGLKKRPRTTLI